MPDFIGRAKILIIDDEELSIEVLRDILHKAGYQHIEGTTDSWSARDLYQAFQPDLVVMDLAMPLMNGVEAAIVLRNTMPKVPIVLFTLYAEQLRGAISPSFGVTLIVSKADGLAALLGSLKRLLPSD